jgi:hypothetical protein
VQDFAQDVGPGDAGSSIVRDSARLVLGLVLMVLGVAAVLGGVVLYFGNKSGRLVTFPFAGGFTILVGLGVMAVGVAWSGPRGAIGFGATLLVCGLVLLPIGMFTSEPSYRICGPAGFGLALLGGLIVRGGLDFAKEQARPPAAET